MSDGPTDSAEWDELVAAASEGDLSPEGWERIRTIVQAQPHLIDAVADHLLLDSLLREQHQAEHLSGCIDMMDTMHKPSGIVRPWVQRPRTRAWLGRSLVAASVTLIIALGIMTYVLQQTRTTQPATTPQQDLVNAAEIGAVPIERTGVALLVRAVEAEWGQAQQQTPGQMLFPGRLHLVAGMAQIDFYSGARVILTGPADFEINSVMGGILHAGSLRAHVPPGAEGFTITSAAAKIVDLGTEFGMVVNDSGLAEVHVFDGTVEVVPRSQDHTAPLREMSTGDSVRISPDGSVQTAVLSTTQFPDVKLLQQQDEHLRRARRQTWDDYVAALHKDPRLVFHFNFSHALTEQNVITSTTATHTLRASVIGCELAADRWLSGKAAAYRHDSDRVRFRLTDTFTALTFSAWVRIDALGPTLMALILTDKWKHGDIHWQIDKNGTLVLDISHQDLATGRKMKGRAEAIINSSHFGRWIMLSAVYDSEQRIIRHYLDGKRVSQNNVIESLPIVIDKAEIGNWIVPRQTGRAPVRNFNGKIDDVMLFNTALSDEEIARLYAAGNPY